jgi:hypothetical protein
VRSVPLIPQAAERLLLLRQRAGNTADDDFVFVGPRGGVIDDSRLRRRFYDALARAGLPHMRVHDLRHSFGTLAVQAFPLSEVAAFMGHADITTTMIYVHHVPKAEAAARLAQVMAPSTTDSSVTPGAKSVRPLAPLRFCPNPHTVVGGRRLHSLSTQLRGGPIQPNGEEVSL